MGKGKSPGDEVGIQAFRMVWGRQAGRGGGGGGTAGVGISFALLQFPLSNKQETLGDETAKRGQIRN